MTNFLRFPDEAAAINALADYHSDDYGWSTASLVHALDPVGVLYDPGTYDDDGSETTPPVALEGWHVNFIGELPEAAQAFVVAPGRPQVVFA